MPTKREDGAFDRDLVGRLQRALTAGTDELFQSLQDPAPEVLRAALKNRQLREDHLQALLRRRDLPEDLLKAIYQRPEAENSHRLQLALAKNPNTPGAIVLSILPRLFIFELLNLCLLAGATPDQKYAAEREIIKRLPTVPLGNKMTLARRGTGNLVAEILKEGDAPLVAICLDSPHLQEIALVQFLTGPKATAETISSLARHPKWKSRANLRLAILKNPRTPDIWYTLFLPQLRTIDLNALLGSRRLRPAQKALVAEALKKRG
ncbi:MAG: hypothetical protein WDA20_05215 [Desulfuromonadales bacterium]